MKKYRQASPDRAKVWTEKSPKYKQRQRHNGTVPVVYYLCKNRQLEHPHFMEVSLSSPDGLYLRDVIERLSVLRGRGMTSMYSWSCKRSYKNGFVWHDLCDNDLILPAHGNEYILKGSELFEESVSGRCSPAGNATLQCVKVLPDPQSSKSQEESSSSSSLNGRFRKSSPDDELSTPVERPCSSSVSPDSSHRKTSAWNGSLSLTEFKVYENDGLADASTQTEENVNQAVETQSTCTRGVSTDDQFSENPVPRVTETSEICRISTPPSTTSASSSDRTDTLESLIRADAQKFNSFRIIEDDFRIPSHAKLRASNMLLQLISCGSFSVKDHSFGLIPTYKPRFSHSKFPSPMFSTSFMLGEPDFHAENPSPISMKPEDKECFTGSLVGKNTIKEGVSTPKQSSSFNSDRHSKQLGCIQEKVESSSTHSKWIPRSIKSSLDSQPRSESMRSPLSNGRRISSDGEQSSQAIAQDTPITNIGSDRFSNHFLGETQSLSTKQGSLRNGEENVFKIEERLASGARVIIQSKASMQKDNF